MSRSKGRSKTERAPTSTPDEQAHTNQTLIVCLYSLALMSGASALIYQVVWAKMLALAFGSTTLAAAAVISGFIGGMGVGARLYDVVHRRVPRPLLIYGCLEIGIAVSTALLTRSFHRLPPFVAEISNSIPSGGSMTLVRFVLVFILLAIPAALMGATFPALCMIMIKTAKAVDRRLGMVYGINTIGGAVGALVAGLYLTDQFGLTGSVNLANGLNVFVGLASFILLGTSLARDHAGPATARSTAIPTQLPRWVTGVVLVVSGFATFSYELLWFRSFRYVVGNSTFALSTVLMVFLVGLGLGSLLLGRIVRRQTPERDLGWCQCLVAVLALGATGVMMLVTSLPALRDYVSIFSEEVLRRPWWWRLVIDVGVATVVMVPATLAMGLSFPLASRLFLGDIRKLSPRMGWAYLLANMGSILGCIVAALWLLPVLGTIGGAKIVAIVNLLLGTLVLLALPQRTFRSLAPAAVAGIAVVAMCVALPATTPLSGEELAPGIAGDQVFFEEGDMGTVQVLALPEEPAVMAMAIDGYKIAWNSANTGTQATRKQALLAHLPMVLDTRNRHTLNVGLGGGSTLHTLASYPYLETLDCVEINPAVVHGSELFEESSVLQDPRVRLIIDDAVQYLLRSTKRYDVIISDGKHNTHYPGNANLLCREYYRLALEDPTENGLFVQWIPLGSLANDTKVILRTLCDVFPYVEVFYYPRESILMVASSQPLSGRPMLSYQRFIEINKGNDSGARFLNRPEVFLAGWTAGRPQLQDLLKQTPISTWDHVILDTSVFKSSIKDFRSARYENLALLLSAEELATASGEQTFEQQEGIYFKSAWSLRRAWKAYFGGQISTALQHAQNAVKANPADRQARSVLATFQETANKVGGGP